MQVILLNTQNEEVTNFPPTWEGANPEYVIYEGKAYHGSSIRSGDVYYIEYNGDGVALIS